MSEIDWLDDEEERGIESNKEGARAMTDDKLIEAAKLLRDNCEEHDCSECIFWQIRGWGGCELQFTAKHWDMPEVQDND